jgi:hypothetical protein
MRRNSECVSRPQPMPPAAKKTPAAPAPAADTAPVKNPAIAKPAPAPKVAPPAKNAALAAVAAAMAATAAGAAPQKAAAANPTITVEDGSKPRRWIVKKTLNKFRANLRSVPDYYLPKFIQLIAAEVAPRCDGDQLLSRSNPSPPPPPPPTQLCPYASRQVSEVLWHVAERRHDFGRECRSGTAPLPLFVSAH